LIGTLKLTKLNFNKMEKKYNNWYWKLYRWCKWKLPYQHKYFIYGVKNLWRWFWVIWNDRDWDHDFYWKITKKKISQMRDLHVKNMRFVNTPREIEKMNVVLKLIERVQDDTYRSEYYDEKYYLDKMRIEENGICHHFQLLHLHPSNTNE